MEKILNLIMDIGEEMLISGAEVHRVEESITRMCCASGAESTDVFIITSSMITTAYLPNGESISQTRRIHSLETNYEKLHQLNDLSRRICANKMTVEGIRAEIERIKNGKTYPFWLECLCYAVIAGAFTLFFGGNHIEMLVSFVVGGIVRLGLALCNRLEFNRIFNRFFSAALATALALLATKLALVSTVDKIIIGNIMTLIPGVGLTTALRDLFTGDSMTGLLRTIEAVLLALAIAAGYFLVTLMGGIVL